MIHFARTCHRLTSRSTLAMLLVCVSPHAFAQTTAPQPQTLEEQRKNLEITKQELSTSKQKHEEIKGSLSKLEKDLAAITQETQTIAESMQSIERTLSELEDELIKLNTSKKEKQDSLNKRGSELSGMIGAMIRLGRAPQEAVIVMPQGIAGKIRASRALGLMSDSIQKEMHAITVQMDELKQVENDISQRQLSLKKQNVSLLERRETLALAMKNQQDLLNALHSKDLEEQQHIANLSRKSEDLKSLVMTLEREREKQRLERVAQQKAEEERLKRLAASQPSPTQQTKPQSLENNKIASKSDEEGEEKYASVTMPVAGRITAHYGQKRGANNTLKGIEFSTRSNAIVTSPSAGEVLFTGPFLDYGKMVIIRHNARHHTLLAGFDQVQCRAGQHVSKGSPLGVMGDTPITQRLYMELRDQGKPVDPIPWLSKGATVAKQ
jgi:septal ring factor EnvC (AmiA/AmiB activator)